MLPLPLLSTGFLHCYVQQPLVSADQSGYKIMLPAANDRPAYRATDNKKFVGG